jgi:hypothetical protein
MKMNPAISFGAMLLIYAGILILGGGYLLVQGCGDYQSDLSTALRLDHSGEGEAVSARSERQGMAIAMILTGLISCTAGAWQVLEYLWLRTGKSGSRASAKTGNVLLFVIRRWAQAFWIVEGVAVMARALGAFDLGTDPAKTTADWTAVAPVVILAVLNLLILNLKSRAARISAIVLDSAALMICIYTIVDGSSEWHHGLLRPAAILTAASIGVSLIVLIAGPWRAGRESEVQSTDQNAAEESS